MTRNSASWPTVETEASARVVPLTFAVSTSSGMKNS